jgi:hypothetical protein
VGRCQSREVAGGGGAAPISLKTEANFYVQPAAIRSTSETNKALSVSARQLRTMPCDPGVIGALGF